MLLAALAAVGLGLLGLGEVMAFALPLLGLVGALRSGRFVGEGRILARRAATRVQRGARTLRVLRAPVARVPRVPAAVEPAAPRGPPAALRIA